MRWLIEARLPPEPEFSADEQTVTTKYVVLGWDDLVKQRMAAPLPQRLARAMTAFFGALWDGSIPNMLRQAWIPVVATLYPFLFVLIYLFTAMGTTITVTWVASTWLGVSWVWTAPLGVLTGWVLLNLAEVVDERTFALYLVDLYSLVRDLSRDRAPEIETRIDEFAARIVEASRARLYDEILVVGHSGGGQLAASALARALREEPDVGRQGANVGLLTLGQFITAQMQLPDGARQRAEYKSVAQSPNLVWIDVSALSDAVCYGLCDPLAEPGGALPSTERRAGPKVISAAFKDTMAPESFAAIRGNHFRRHFQYLYVFEKPRAFDYFRITAGPISLAARFRDVKTNHRAPPTAAELDDTARTHDSAAAV